MPRKRMAIMERALNLFKTSMLMAKMEKYTTPRLIFLKKTRKLKKLKLLKHYNYGFIKDCLSVEGAEFEGESEVHYALEALPNVEDGGEKELSSESFDRRDEDFSVDQRAEKFIQRFYEEMRIQRQETVLQVEGIA
ncbi:hypothetical protein IFM89_039750 [Coptis chinensis]|uniref:Cotton fiber protein n=1 Tax=Coptis chinensis TaxID=261450 RepID=A0A835LCT8_9MAGN|nr:hypothetical protein IFM89_039750 [Coptis chinensis]